MPSLKPKQMVLVWIGIAVAAFLCLWVPWVGQNSSPKGYWWIFDPEHVHGHSVNFVQMAVPIVLVCGLTAALVFLPRYGDGYWITADAFPTVLLALIALTIAAIVIGAIITSKPSPTYSKPVPNRR